MGSAIASPDSDGDDATPTATTALNRSRLSMSPNLCRRRETVDYLEGKLARQIAAALLSHPDRAAGAAGAAARKLSPLRHPCDRPHPSPPLPRGRRAEGKPPPDVLLQVLPPS